MKSTFSPLKTSSPRSNNNQSKSRTKSTSSETNRSRLESNLYDIHQKKNLRIMTLNCRSIKDKKAEFEMAVHYLKPDIICGTEFWLKEVKPVKTSKDAIKSSEIFTAIQRGTVAGFGFPDVAVVAIGLHKAIKYRVTPNYYQTNQVVSSNIPEAQYFDFSRSMTQEIPNLD